MGIVDYFNKIYTGKENILKHICLFSMLGILAILSSRCFAYYFGFSYFGYAPASRTETALSQLFSIIIIVYNIGYIYNFAHNLQKDEKSALPDISFEPFYIFIKIIPILIVWTIYIVLAVLLGLGLFNLKNNLREMILYYGLILFIIPFIHIVWVKYSKNFSINFKYYNPLIIIKVISKFLLPMTRLLIILIPIFCIFILIPHYICIYSTVIKNLSFQLALRLLALTLWIYLTCVINMINIQGIAEILQQKINE